MERIKKNDTLHLFVLIYCFSLGTLLREIKNGFKSVSIFILKSTAMFF